MIISNTEVKPIYEAIDKAMSEFTELVEYIDTESKDSYHVPVKDLLAFCQAVDLARSTVFNVANDVRTNA